MHKMLKFNIKFKHENVQYFCLKEHLEVHIFSYFSQKLYRKGKEKVKKKNPGHLSFLPHYACYSGKPYCAPYYTILHSLCFHIV